MGNFVDILFKNLQNLLVFCSPVSEYVLYRVKKKTHLTFTSGQPHWQYWSFQKYTNLLWKEISKQYSIYIYESIVLPLLIVDFQSWLKDQFHFLKLCLLYHHPTNTKSYKQFRLIRISNKNLHSLNCEHMEWPFQQQANWLKIENIHLKGKQDISCLFTIEKAYPLEIVSFFKIVFLLLVSVEVFLVSETYETERKN